MDSKRHPRHSGLSPPLVSKDERALVSNDRYPSLVAVGVINHLEMESYREVYHRKCKQCGSERQRNRSLNWKISSFVPGEKMIIWPLYVLAMLFVVSNVTPQKINGHVIVSSVLVSSVNQ